MIKALQCLFCSPQINLCPLEYEEAEALRKQLKEKEDELRMILQKLPAQYTMDEFWKVAEHYKKYVSKPPARYLLNLYMTHPWDIDRNADMIYSEWELIKN